MGKTTTVRSIMGIDFLPSGKSLSKAGSCSGFRPTGSRRAASASSPRDGRSFPTSRCARTWSPPRAKGPGHLQRVYDLFAHLREREKTLRKSALGRRAADARHRPRADDQPEAADPRRGDRGPRAADARRDLPLDREAESRRPVDPDHRQGREGADHGSPTGITSWRRAASSGAEPAASSQPVPRFQHRYLGV